GDARKRRLDVPGDRSAHRPRPHEGMARSPRLRQSRHERRHRSLLAAGRIAGERDGAGGVPAPARGRTPADDPARAAPGAPRARRGEDARLHPLREDRHGAERARGGDVVGGLDRAQGPPAGVFRDEPRAGAEDPPRGSHRARPRHPRRGGSPLEWEDFLVAPRAVSAMLLWFVIAYWIISVAIGLYAARWVHNTRDFAVAGRRLPMYIVTATVFATWFGSETVLGIPASFIKDGFSGVIADPFGSSLCLIIVGLFFARPLYRMNLLTIGDYYRKRFSRPVEMLTTLCIVISYLGWVGAQIKALGLVFNVVSDGSITQPTGMVIGAATVLVYTMLGGMFSVAITDFIQMIIIVVGMLYIGWEVSGLAGGVTGVISKAASDGKFHLLPAPNAKEVLGFFAAWITMMLGSIPQQDVFQRVQSSKDEATAGRSSILGGVLYFCFAFIPMFLAYSAMLIEPKMVAGYLESDPQ